MMTRLACLILAAVATSSANAADRQLFQIETADAYYREIERGEDLSLVEATAANGTAASKSMFMLRSTCSLMKERGKTGFKIEPISRDPIRFKVHFVVDSDRGPDDTSNVRARGMMSARVCEQLMQM